MMPLNVAESFTSPQVAINSDLGNCSLKLYNLFCIEKKNFETFRETRSICMNFCVEDYLCGNRTLIKKLVKCSNLSVL